MVHADAVIQAATFYRFSYKLSSLKGDKKENSAVVRAEKELEKRASSDCVLQNTDISIVGKTITVTFECLESIGREKEIPKDIVQRQKELESIHRANDEIYYKKEQERKEREKREREEKLRKKKEAESSGAQP